VRHAKGDSRKGDSLLTIRVATFNVENLFARYRFRQDFDATGEDGFTINDLAFDIYDEESKRITAKSIREVDADIFALQEIESLPVQERFAERYLAGRGYRYRLVIDGNDPRFIDVGVLSKYPIAAIRTHRHERNNANTARLFSRDCLEVDIDVDGKTLTLFINHFKSMVEGRGATRARRLEQATRVAALVDAAQQADGYTGNLIVLGDLNDYYGVGTGLAPLLDHPGLENVLGRLIPEHQWTHFFARAGEYRQLDYVLLSAELAAANANSPGVMRRGLPWRAFQEGPWEGPPPYDEVGESHPKASDHAPLFMDLDLI